MKDEDIKLDELILTLEGIIETYNPIIKNGYVFVNKIYPPDNYSLRHERDAALTYLKSLEETKKEFEDALSLAKDPEISNKRKMMILAERVGLYLKDHFDVMELFSRIGEKLSEIAKIFYELTEFTKNPIETANITRLKKNLYPLDKALNPVLKQFKEIKRAAEGEKNGN